MIRKKNNSATVTDGEGKKWVKTSPEDLFTIREINDVMRSFEDADDNEIILAHVDFKKVNREYYDAVKELQERLRRKDLALKNLAERSRRVIERKNEKLNELIQYIRKLHMVVAHYQKGKDASLISVAEIAPPPVSTEQTLVPEVAYAAVREYFLDEKGEEIEY